MEMRKQYQATLAQLMEDDSRIVMMDADLASASGSSNMFARFPERCINVGISEANMISAAAGLSRTGLLPFVHSFAPFATRRVFDQAFMSGVYSQNRIHIYGSDPGFWAQHNGGTHTSYEDVALMRTLPNAVVSAPCDAKQFDFVLREFTKHHTVFYTRAIRKELPDIYDEDQQFELGKIIVHGDHINSGDNEKKNTSNSNGSRSDNLTSNQFDCIIFAMGEMMHEALQAQNELTSEGMKVIVLDCFSLKPFDIKTAMHYISQTKLVITIENHNVIGGLYSIVSEVMGQFQHQAIAIPIAVMDTFGEVGTEQYLRNKHQLTSTRIISIIKSHIA